MPIVNDPERKMTVDTETGYFIRNQGGYARGLLEGFEFGQVDAYGQERSLGGFSAANASAPKNGTVDPVTDEEIVSFYYQIRGFGSACVMPKERIAELAMPLLEKHLAAYDEDGWRAEHIVTINLTVGQYDPFYNKG